MSVSRDGRADVVLGGVGLFALMGFFLAMIWMDHSENLACVQAGGSYISGNCYAHGAKVPKFGNPEDAILRHEEHVLQDGR